MHTAKSVGLNDTQKHEDVKFMLSSKGCIGCIDTGTDIMFAIDTTEIGTSDTKITQIFMTNNETLLLMNQLQKALQRNILDMDN